MDLYDKYFREMSALLAAILVALIIIGCGPAVRDRETYKAEVEFMEAAASEQIDRGVAMIDAFCKCETMMGERGFTTTECQDLAETILVVKYRMGYHTAFMRYLGGLDDRRPPKIPSEVPEASSLCPSVDVGEPMDIPDELEFVSDGGVDAGD